MLRREFGIHPPLNGIHPKFSPFFWTSILVTIPTYIASCNNMKSVDSFFETHNLSKLKCRIIHCSFCLSVFPSDKLLKGLLLYFALSFFNSILMH